MCWSRCSRRAPAPASISTISCARRAARAGSIRKRNQARRVRPGSSNSSTRHGLRRSRPMAPSTGFPPMRTPSPATRKGGYEVADPALKEEILALRYDPDVGVYHGGRARPRQRALPRGTPRPQGGRRHALRRAFSGREGGGDAPRCRESPMRKRAPQRSSRRPRRQTGRCSTMMRASPSPSRRFWRASVPRPRSGLALRQLCPPRRRLWRTRYPPTSRSPWTPRWPRRLRRSRLRTAPARPSLPEFPARLGGTHTVLRLTPEIIQILASFDLFPKSERRDGRA